jgi:protein O-GlcNAc transferase
MLCATIRLSKSPPPAMTPKQILQEGLRLHQSGRLAEAASRYRQVLEQEPDSPDATHYLGLLAYQNKRYDDAVRLIGKSIGIKADSPPAHSNLGNALAMLGRYAEAEAAFRNALALDPRLADAWFNLANVQREQQKFDDADAAYRQVISLRPDHTGAYNNLANLLLIRDRKTEAAEAFHYLGDALQDVGRTADAVNAYHQSLAISPEPGVEVKLTFLTPAIPMSSDEIDRTRERLSSGIAKLTAQGTGLSDPLRYASSAIFYTVYHGCNDRELRTRLAQFYLRVSPHLAWRAPHCENYGGPGQRIRIGFLSRHFHPEHPMTKLYGGIVEHLDRRKFDVTLFRFDSPSTPQFWGDTRVVVLGETLDAARAAISQARLDVLFYTDIGMEPTTYFLAFSRLAPVQCVTFGHPVTSGIGTIDYFLSSQELDTSDAQDHYSEMLVRLSTVPTYFKRPQPAATAPTRTDLGLPENARLYFCAQNLIKFHPEFDAVLAQILQRDPKGLLVLINNKSQQLGQLLLERLRRALPEAMDRIVFLPFLKLDALLGCLQLVDAVLDTPVFGGGTTSLEMFAVDTPIVTWPGRFARSRITHALYRQMGLDGLSAQSATQYVELALRLANDPAWRTSLQEELRQKKHVLYENIALVRELEQFFTAAVSASQRGHKLRDWSLGDGDEGLP